VQTNSKTDCSSELLRIYETDTCRSSIPFQQTQDVERGKQRRCAQGRIYL